MTKDAIVLLDSVRIKTMNLIYMSYVGLFFEINIKG